MYWLVSVLVFETIIEGLICIGLFAGQSRTRKLLCVVMGALLLVAAVALAAINWAIWIWNVPFVLYRLINLLRLYHSRLPAPQLRTVSVRAFGWLVAAETATVALAWLGYAYHFDATLLDILVACQLLAAVVLLRASTHTWGHAAFPAMQDHLADKQLPAVSVLVPARNETDDLDTCLQALVASDYPKLEILVLDDCSANRHTPEIIRSFAHSGVRFLQGKVPEEAHWLAKNYAYEQLAKEASGDLLLFCGVDALFSPASIRKLVELLENRQKDMLSVMPLRQVQAPQDGHALLQVMRYYWEICMPRGFFKRPPVLSTCWIIRKEALKRMGGFEAVSRSITPEAPFARQAVVTDAYSFLRSDDDLGVYSNKPASEQYGTSVRIRYPQLHRRLELIAVVSIFEVVFLLGPLLGLFFIGHLAHAMAYVSVWTVALACLLITYCLVAVSTRLVSVWYGWLLMPVAFIVDLIMLHISLWKYEFGSVDWKGRNVCIPVMRIADRSPADSHALKSTAV